MSRARAIVTTLVAMPMTHAHVRSATGQSWIVS
jgi:hypothetical protein